MTWHSALTLAFDNLPIDSATRLVQREHQGALRVQKALYPEAGTQEGICHVIMLYPPAGIALGDDLAITIGLKNAAQAVLTTPGANKWYGTLPNYSAKHPPVHAKDTTGTAKNPTTDATQNLTVYLQDNSRFEWLPQENCFYNASHARSTNQFFLSPDASLMTWEINLLGRAYHGERYDTGSLDLTNVFWRIDGDKSKLLLADTLNKTAQDAWFGSAVGLNSHSVFATFWVVPSVNETHHIVDWVKQLRLVIDQYQFPLTCTQTDEVLIIRYLGDDARQCLNAFGAVRGELRQFMWQQDNHLSRIWAT